MYKQATQKTGEVLSMPPRWLGMYSDFIIKNSSAVTQIESALRSLTYIIPGTHMASERYTHKESCFWQPANSCRTVPGIRDCIRIMYVLAASYRDYCS